MPAQASVNAKAAARKAQEEAERAALAEVAASEVEADASDQEPTAERQTAVSDGGDDDISEWGLDPAFWAYHAMFARQVQTMRNVHGVPGVICCKRRRAKQVVV